MSFAVDISKEYVEKIGLVVVSPRVRHTGWADLGGGVFSTTFTKGPVTAVWVTTGQSGPGLFNQVASAGLVGSGQFHYDHSTKILTAGTIEDPEVPNIISQLIGVTVQFEIHLSTRPIYGRRDPLDDTYPDIVTWEPALISAPSATNGSQNDIFGFQPVNIANVVAANNGWLNELMHDVSWYLAPIRSYLLVGSDYERAIQSSGVAQTFSGFIVGVGESGKQITFSCSDYTKKLDVPFFDLRKFTISMGIPDPQAVGAWFIPKIFGAVDGVTPVNIDYSASPSTTNNRDWVTHDRALEAPGDITLTIDHTAANTATRTFFTTTPGLNISDRVTLNHASGVRRVRVTNVDRDLKFIDHASIVRVVVAAETCDRPFVAAVNVIDRDGTVYDLVPGVDYNTVNNVGDQLLGFTLVDNFEAGAGLAHTPFDPAQDQIICRVYGTKELPIYEDLTDVGALSRASGVAAEGVSLISRMLLSALIFNTDWDKTSFEAVGADSHTLGVMIPNVLGGQPETFKDIISKLLTSQLWKLGHTITAGGKIKIGLVAQKPFDPAFDFAVDKTELAEFSWEQDYSDIYSDISARFKASKTPFTATGSGLQTSTTTKENLRAKYVHLSTETFDVELSQFDEEEAEITASRLMFILGERRGVYRIKLPYTQLLNAKVGANYQITRDHLPGFAYAFDAENARTLNLIEVQKDLATVQLLMDDQKGIQDNSGDWE